MGERGVQCQPYGTMKSFFCGRVSQFPISCNHDNLSSPSRPPSRSLPSPPRRRLLLVPRHARSPFGALWGPFGRRGTAPRQGGVKQQRRGSGNVQL
jgi:hypothetical protein